MLALVWWWWCYWRYCWRWCCWWWCWWLFCCWQSCSWCWCRCWCFWCCSNCWYCCCCCCRRRLCQQIAKEMLSTEDPQNKFNAQQPVIEVRVIHKACLIRCWTEAEKITHYIKFCRGVTFSGTIKYDVLFKTTTLNHPNIFSKNLL